jgi:multiple sugar transport system permease protein
MLPGRRARSRVARPTQGASVTSSTAATSPAAGPGGSWRDRFRDTASGWLFLAPFLVIYLVFLLYPVVQAVFMGFFEVDLLVISDREYVGLDHYVRMFWGTEMTWSLTQLAFWRILGLLLIPLVWYWQRQGSISRRFAIVSTIGLLVLFLGVLGIHPGEGGRWYDSQFWLSFGNTVLFVLLSTPLIVGVGLAIAIALNRPGRWAGVLRTLFFAPYVLSVAVLTLIWAFLLNPQLGLVGATFELFGLEPINWLNSTTWAMPAIVVTTLWWTVGFNVVLFLAGLQDIEPSMYEAASLDGAGSWAKFRFITVPGLQRTLLLVIVLQVIASFQIFGQVFIMTRGGPNGATRVAIQHIYESAFRDFELGYASAMSVFLFVVMIVIAAGQFRFLQPSES